MEPPRDGTPQDGTKLETIKLSELEAYEALSSLDSSKAMGLDGIGPNVLKSCSLALCGPLLHLLQLYLDSQTIPQEWKLHGITPVHKPADRASVTNYRQISLLSSTSKVLEHLVFTRCIEALSACISSTQFGFLGGRCTVQQLLLFFHEIRTYTSQWKMDPRSPGLR